MFIKDPGMFRYYFYECNKQPISKGTLRSEQKLIMNEITSLKYILRVLKRF